MDTLKEDKILDDEVSIAHKPRPIIAEHPFYPANMLRNNQNEIYHMMSLSGASIIFEKQDKSTFFVNAIPERDNSERKIMVLSNEKPLEHSKWKLNKEITSKDAITALKKWGGGVKDLATLSDFLQGKLRTVNIEEEKNVEGSLDSTGPKGSAKYSMKKKTANFV
jgi:hypothetical protein